MYKTLLHYDWAVNCNKEAPYRRKGKEGCETGTNSQVGKSTSTWICTATRNARLSYLARTSKSLTDFDSPFRQALNREVELPATRISCALPSVPDGDRQPDFALVLGFAGFLGVFGLRERTWVIGALTPPPTL